MAYEGSTWEYRVIDGADAEILIRLGADGWELVAVVGVGGRWAGTTCYFKRPGPSFRERVTLDQRRASFDQLGGNAAGEGER